MSKYLGLYSLESELDAAIAITIGGLAVDPDGGNPTYRVYEGDALLPSGTGSLTPMDTGSITGATNASPIEITSTAHGLQSGNAVVITNVGGNTAANGTFTITRTAANTFTLNGSTGNGAYTSGGSWHVAGLYLLSITLSAGAGYEVGKTYQVRIDFNDDSDAYAIVVYFGVT